MKAVYRPTPDADWQDCEILGSVGGNYVIREVGKVWPGVALTPHVRIPAGVIFQPEILRRKYLPAGIDRWGKYRTIREAVGRDAALAVLAEPKVGAP
jgi:hypothetical protein